MNTLRDTCRRQTVSSKHLWQMGCAVCCMSQPLVLRTELRFWFIIIAYYRYIYAAC